MDKIDSFFNSIKDKTVAFIGIGVSHTDTIKYFAKKGINTLACDKKNSDDFDPTLLAELRALGVKLVLGGFDITNLGADIIFRTPGMYFLSDEISAFRKSGGIVTSEMEVFFKLCPAKTFAITGSDGKTTTSTLIAEMLKKSGYNVHLGGNIGRALLPEVENIKPEDFAVVELSSFQLLSMRPDPDVSVITNITPNHLDVHKDMNEYIDAKKNIFLHQDAFTKTVLNADDALVSSFENQVRGSLSYFSIINKVCNGAYLNGEIITLVKNSSEMPLFNKNDIKIPGVHNVYNFLTAISAVCDYVEPSTMHQFAKKFGGVEHRIEFVREINGVKWYNDSIASSPTRTIAGLNSFDQKLILIAGGYDKKVPFTPLAPELIKHVKLLILAGPSSTLIEQALLDNPDYNGSPEIIKVTDIPEAVSTANSIAKNGDIVILSPASTSFDAYPNFEHRGRHFKQLVNSL